jgi:hypothetical protein
MKPPASVEVWNSKIGTTKDEWAETWKVKPRDLVSGMKIQRRNLWMASAGGCGSRTCRAQGCRGTENQEHMATCRVIKYGYWKKVERLATKLGLNMEHEPGAHPGKLWSCG